MRIALFKGAGLALVPVVVVTLGAVLFSSRTRVPAEPQAGVPVHPNAHSRHVEDGPLGRRPVLSEAGAGDRPRPEPGLPASSAGTPARHPTPVAQQVSTPHPSGPEEAGEADLSHPGLPVDGPVSPSESDGGELEGGELDSGELDSSTGTGNGQNRTGAPDHDPVNSRG